MIGQQHRVMLMRNSSHSLSEFLIAWPVIRDQRQRADFHYVIGGDWREHVCGIHVCEAGHGHGVSRVKMHDSTGACAHVIDGEMQKALLRFFVSADQPTLVVEFGERGRIKFRQATRLSVSSANRRPRAR